VKKQLKIIFFLILIMLLVSGWGKLFKGITVKKELVKGKVWCIQKYIINDYVIEREYHNKESGDTLTLGPGHDYVARITIRKNGKVVYDDSGLIGDHYLIDGQCIENTYVYTSRGCIPLVGQDINNDGIPEFVLGEWTGGAHCCYTYKIFSLGNEFKKIAELDSGDEVFIFQDIDNDGSLEIIGRDWEIADFNPCGPSPKIILKYIKGNYVLAMDLMKSHISDYDKWLKENGKKGCNELSEYYNKPSYAVDLIYTGNADKAWAFLFGNLPGKEKADAVGNFKKGTLSVSPYWNYVKEYYKW
jgi:hypothetical protein